MNTPNFKRILVVPAVLAAVALGLTGQAPVTGGRRAAEPDNGTDPAELAKGLKQLQHGPQLPNKYVPNWPTLPKGYNMGEATGVDVDSQGNVWVANRGAWPVMEFDRSGKMLQAWSHDAVRVTEGMGKGAHGLKVDVNGNIWLGDVDGHVNFKFSREGRLLMILGNRQGVPNGNDSKTGFNRPTNFWPLTNGNMLISDGYGNSRVAEFTNDGHYVRHFGTHGSGDGQLNLPHGVTMDSSGRIYVADRSNSRIQVFETSGKFLAKWTDIGQPWDVYYASKENAIYMCDGKWNRIAKIDMEGKLVGELSHFGHGPGELDFAHAIAVTPDGSQIYVVEIKNWRVQKWAR